MNTSETSQNFHDEIVLLLPRLRRFARNLVRNPHDADDVVQAAVEKALLRSAQWRRDARLDSWIFKIVRNTWIDEVRSRGRRDKLFLAEEAGEHVGTRAHRQRDYKYVGAGSHGKDSSRISALRSAWC